MEMFLLQRCDCLNEKNLPAKHLEHMFMVLLDLRRKKKDKNT